MRLANLCIALIMVLIASIPLYPQSLERISGIVTLGDCQDVFIEGDLAYVADGEMGLTLIDISNPASPNYIGTSHSATDDIAKSVWKRGGDDIAFVADMDGKIMTVDVSLPLNPNSNRNLSLGWDQNVEDLYGIVYQDTIYLLTVSSGFQRQHLSFFQIVYRSGVPGFGDYYIVEPYVLPASAYGVYAESSYAHVADGVGGLFIFDISDMWQPELASSLDLIGRSLSVMVQGNYAYLAAETAGLIIVDITDKYNPFMLSQYDIEGRATDIHIVGSRAYLVDDEYGLTAIDISDPANPNFICGYETSGSANGVYADESYIYVADFDSLLILHFNLTGFVERDVEKTKLFSFQGNYPNPFNVSTTLNFSLNQTSNIKINIYNLTGQKVQTLVNDTRPAGEYKLSWNVPDLPSGVYFAQLEIDQYSESIKLLLLK